MQNTVNVRLQQAYKAEADWKSSDPVGKKGEIMISSDKNGMFKVGNGTSKWSELNYNNANYASSAGSVAWGNVSGKPSSMPASDVYAWAKASSKPSYSWSEITGKPSTFTPASHTHTTSQITDFPESLKNPNSVIITLNGGSTEGTNLFTYDGSTPKTLNITPAIIGAAASSHTHDDRYFTESEMNSKLSSYLPLTGGTVSGQTTFNAGIDTVGIEIYHSSAPFIDFHYKNDATTDYTSRIIENAKGVLNINGATFTSGGSVWCPTLKVDNAITGNLNGCAKTLALGGDLNYPATFNWSGQNGQPTWVWGGSDMANMYVYDPSNFNVSSAKYLTLKGTNTYQGADDNTGNWGNQGFSLHWYNANLLKHQPMMFMYVMNLTMGGSEVHQIACAQAGGSLYHRGGNTAGWSPADGSWATVLDDRNYTSFCLPLGGGTITGDLKVNSKITTSSIELYDATPYIDFHFDGNSGDYTSRIIENTSGVLNINGATFTNGGAIWSKWITVDGSISVTQAGNFGSGVACANESRFYVNSYTDPMPGVTCAIKATGIIAANALYATGSGSNVEAQVHAKNDSRDAYLCASSSGRAGIYDTKHGWIIFNDNDCRTTYIQECKVYNGKVTAKADSTSWLVGASPGGASFESINITDGALVPIWRCRTVDGAWVGASYASDPGFRIYYANNARLKAQTDNGTDARFTFGASGIMYATSFSNTSDERKKDVIDFLSDTLPSSHKNFFMKLRPFTFKWNDNLLDKQSHYGVGAQSVYQAALDCGFTDDDLGFIHKGKELPGTSIPWSVSYTEFIPLNIAVTQDHETRIKKLERENEELKQQIKELKGLTA